MIAPQVFADDAYAAVNYAITEAFKAGVTVGVHHLETALAWLGGKPFRRAEVERWVQRLVAETKKTYELGG